MAAGEKAEHIAKLKELSTRPVEEQCKTFLRAFVCDFQGKFEEVLSLSAEFRSALEKSGDTDMDERVSHLFLEKRGEVHTIVELREKLKLIDLDCNHRMSFTEYALFKYGKKLKDLFEAAPNAALIAKLEAAIAKFEAVQKEKEDKAKKISELEAQVKAGGPGAPKAKAELRRLQMEDPASSGQKEIEAMAERLKAKAALRNPGEEAKRMQEEAWREEQARVEAEKKRKEEEERKAKEESRQRLKEKSKLWQ